MTQDDISRKSKKDLERLARQLLAEKEALLAKKTPNRILTQLATVQQTVQQHREITLAETEEQRTIERQAWMQYAHATLSDYMEAVLLVYSSADSIKKIAHCANSPDTRQTMKETLNELGSAMTNFRRVLNEVSTRPHVQLDIELINRLLVSIQQLSKLAEAYVQANKHDAYAAQETLKQFAVMISPQLTRLSMQAGVIKKRGRSEGWTLWREWLARRLYELKRGGDKRPYRQLAQEELIKELPESGLPQVDQDEARLTINTTTDASYYSNLVTTWKDKQAATFTGKTFR